MKGILCTLGAPLFCAGVMLAQTPTESQTPMPQSTTNSGMQNGTQTGQGSWVGLLVASSCSADNGNMSRATNSADRMSNMTATPGATPQHESNTTHQEEVSQADRNNTGSNAANTASNRTTEGQATRTADETASRTSTTAGENSSTADTMAQNTNGNGGNGGNGWARAQRVASQMPDSCRITTSTSTFALRLRDGRMVRFDDASNAKIQQQLQSRGNLEHSKKIFRVVVKGNMQGDTIALDSIQM